MNKYANVNMRCVQHLENMARHAVPGNVFARIQYTVFEVAYALHHWRRQLAFHAAHYRWEAQQPPTRALGRCSGDRQDGGGHFTLMLQTSAAVAKPDLIDSEWLQREILKRAQGDLRTAELRPVLKRPMEMRGLCDPRKAFMDAVDELTRAGVVRSWQPSAGDDDSQRSARKRGGWSVKNLRKKPWAQIAADSTAIALVTRLQLSADYFEE